MQLSLLGFGDKWLLLIESIFFGTASIFILAISYRARKLEEEHIDQYNRSSSHVAQVQKRTFYNIFIKKNGSNDNNYKDPREGMYFKSMFYNFLCFTCFFRTIGCLVILGTTYKTNLYWLYILMAQLPSLLFFTTFSVFIYFFARIVMEEESESKNLLKPFFFIFNALTYLFFFGMAMYNNRYLYFDNPQFLKAICGLFGVVYLVFAICMTNYGMRLTLILSNKIENCEREEVQILKAYNVRVISITVIMSLIFAVRAVYNLLFTWGLVPRYFPETVNPIFWESLDSEEVFGSFNPNLNAQLLPSNERVRSSFGNNPLM